MPDTGVFKFIEDLLTQVLGFPPPQWVLSVIAVFLLFGLFILGTQLTFSAIKKIWSILQPTFYNPEDKRRRFQRQMFADHIEGELRRLNNLEAWNDNRFTELEAEVEAEGTKRKFFSFPQKLFFRNSSLRREKSLSSAIEHSGERLVLLEGDPGSGKSVALRHVAQLMATKARSSKNLQTRIPIYINLKYLRRNNDESVNRVLIEEYIYKTLNRVNDRDIDEYLVTEFRRGISDGTWFFLFDSFDEIPEILSSTGTDDLIRQYAEAIRDFLHGMNNCKGIVASREYKGPRFLGWPKFRILPLNSTRRDELIERTHLPIAVQKSISNGLSVATQDFKVLASNPMFLSLICEFMNKKEIPEFPQHLHVVFEEYVNKRLSRDADRLKQRFNKTLSEVKEAAEKLAFCMTADQAIGLGPTLMQLKESAKNFNFDVGVDFEVLTNSLEYLKLAKIEITLLDEQKTFSFAHRRFQEYFATAIVLREPSRVQIDDLLTNGRWRETAVVILQTQDETRIAPIIQRAHNNLLNILAHPSLADLYNEMTYDLDPDEKLPKYKPLNLFKRTFESFRVSEVKIKKYVELLRELSNKKKPPKKPIEWPTGLYHIMSLIQDGMINKRHQLVALAKDIDKFMYSVAEKGDLMDFKWCLELVGISSPEMTTYMMTKALKLKSNLIRETTFRQIFRLPTVLPKITRIINLTLAKMSLENELLPNRNEIYAHLGRISEPSKFIAIARLFAWLPLLDTILPLIGYGLIMRFLEPNESIALLAAIICALVFKWHFVKPSKNLFGIEIYEADMYLLVTTAISLFIPVSIVAKYPEEPRAWLLLSLCFGAFFAVNHTMIANKTSSKAWVVYWGVIFVAYECVSVVRSNPRIVSFFTLIEPVAVFVGLLFIGLFTAAVAIIIFGDWLYLLPRSTLILKNLKSNPKAVMKSAKYLFEANPEVVVLIYFPLFVGFALFFPIIIVISKILIFFEWLITSTGQIGFAVGFVLIFSSLMTGLFVVVKEITREVNTYISWREYEIKKERISIVELVKILESSGLPPLRAKILRDVVKNQMILPTPINLNHLRILISYLGAILQLDNKRDQVSLLIQFAPELEVVIRKPWKESKISAFLGNIFNSIDEGNWNNYQLDELCKLYEQLLSLHTMV